MNNSMHEFGLRTHTFLFLSERPWTFGTVDRLCPYALRTSALSRHVHMGIDLTDLNEQMNNSMNECIQNDMNNE